MNSNRYKVIKIHETDLRKLKQNSIDLDFMDLDMIRQCHKI